RQAIKQLTHNRRPYRAADRKRDNRQVETRLREPELLSHRQSVHRRDRQEGRSQNDREDDQRRKDDEPAVVDAHLFHSLPSLRLVLKCVPARAAGSMAACLSVRSGLFAPGHYFNGVGAPVPMYFAKLRWRLAIERSR